MELNVTLFHTILESIDPSNDSKKRETKKKKTKNTSATFYDELDSAGLQYAEICSLNLFFRGILFFLFCFFFFLFLS